MPKQILVVLSKDPPGMEIEFDKWLQEHIPHVLDEIPGVQTGQRYRLNTDHKFPGKPPSEYVNLVIYEAEGPTDMFNPPPGGGGMPNPPGGFNNVMGLVFMPVGEKVQKES
jgi:hypothetical protein